MNKETKQKSALIISFGFPPIGGSGVERPLKFAKYLPNFGWRPVVLTVKSAVFHAYNLTGMENVKNLTVYRTGLIDFLNIKDKMIKTSLTLPSPAKGEGLEIKKGPLKYLLGIFNQYFLIPDDKIGWMPFAVKEAVKIIKKEKIDVIYTTGDPFSTFLIGLMLKKITKKPWVVDYRDSWTDFELTNPMYFKGKYRQALESLMEFHVLKNADKIISVSPLINDKLQKKHDKIDKEKYDLIYNGYDPDDFNNIQKTKNKKFVITHTGIFNATRSPVMFLGALRELFDEDKKLKENMEIRLIGSSLGEDINELIIRQGLSQNVKVAGYLKHDDCVKEIVNADALLLIQSYDNLEAYSGKIFEYLYSKNPIIALAPPLGCAAELIKKTKSGIIAEENNTENIKRIIKEIYHKRDFTPDMDIIKQYDRVKLTEKLAKIFDELL